MPIARAIPLLIAAAVTLSSAMRKKGTSSRSSSDVAAGGHSSLTRIRFAMPPDVGELSTSFLESSDRECGADTPGPYWSHTPRPERKDLLTIPSGNKAWDEELWELLKQPAAEQVWAKALEVWDCKGTSIARKATAVLNKEVPGLGGVTFLTVLAALYDEGCPVWVLGGAVRDLFAGKTPNDIDTSSLCEVEKVHDIVTSKGWLGYINKNFHYYEIGTRFAEDGLEGKPIHTLYSHPSMGDWTSNMLLLEPQRMYVIDPSGRGISDAKAKTLAPATPGPYNWDAWMVWTESDMKKLRHLRYLKFRVRGWQPYDECFRYYMANDLLNVLLNEPNNPELAMGMSVFLAQHLQDESTRLDAKKSFLRFFEEDLNRGYFQKDSDYARSCGSKKETVAKLSLPRKERARASGLRAFRDTLVRGCKNPTDAWQEVVKKKRLNLTSTCDLVEEFYEWARGGGRTVSFKVGDPVFYKSHTGKFYEAVIDAVYAATNTYDLKYTSQSSRAGSKAKGVAANKVLSRSSSV